MQENTAEKITEENTIEVPLEPEKETKTQKETVEPEVSVATEEKPRDKEEELNEYSEKVQKRIGKLTAKAKEHERRERAALQYAESAKKELEELKAQTQKIDGNYVKELENRVTIQKTALQGQLKKAIDDGDTETQVKVQTELANLAQDNNRLEYIKQQKEEATAQPQQAQTQQAQPQQTPPQQSPDPKAIAWGEKNTWFGDDEVMTNAAFSIHAELVKEGFDSESDEYYNEIDSRLQDYFPNKFAVSEPEVEEKKPVQTVASAGRKQQGRRTVKLTRSQVAIAKKLGVPLEEYAKFVKE